MLSFTRGIAILALGLLVAPPVIAAEHTYPGAMCAKVSGGTPNIDTNAHLENLSSTSTMTVVCPVVGPYNDLSGGQAEVWVTDQHFTDNVCCTARATNATSSGVGIYTGSKACSQGTSNGQQTLSVNPPSVPYTWTSRFFSCTVPPTYSGAVSEIRLYRY